jgi:hypothetical protein
MQYKEGSSKETVASKMPKERERSKSWVSEPAIEKIRSGGLEDGKRGVGP